ncbi:hypothetical protein CC79DRAFT_1373077 [Sarocladium strictum]
MPSCSRCRLRNHDCTYEGESRVTPLAWPMDAVNEEQPLMMMFDDAASTTTGFTSTMLDTPSDLEWLHQDVDFAHTMKLLGPQTITMPLEQDTTPPLMALDASDLLTSPKAPDNLSLSIPVANAETCQIQRMRPDNRGTLQRRQILKHCVLSSVIVGQMTSYPKMMIEGDILPPFISPPCFSREDLAPDCAEHGYHRCLPKILSICTSLVRMYYERTTANAAFVWKSIYDECERLHEDYERYDINEKLSVLQAFAVYVLLQADDGSSAEANGAHRMLSMIVDVAWSLNNTVVWSGEVPRHRPERADWVYSESVSRVIVLLGTLDLLVDGVRPSPTADSKPCGGFCAYPLPCHRDLWLARSNRAWRAAYDRCLASRKGTRILTAAELVQYDSLGLLQGINVNADVPSDVLDIARWAEGLDALGTLVWMILPFQKWRRNEIESSW